MGEDASESLDPAEGPVPERLHEDWAQRPWLLAGLLGLAGLLIHFATDGHEQDPARMALAAFLFFGPLSAALSLERARWKEVALFALIAGLVMAGLAWRAVNTGEHSADEQYGFAAGVLATLLALPLFQAGFHRLRFATPYRDTHFFVWTDAVAGAGALAFVGLSWALLAVLAALFKLIQIDLLSDLMDEGWFGWPFSGVCFGAALGTLRNQLKVLGTLQSVVLLVLSLLAVPLAVALVVFLVAVAFSGLDVLWEATRSATPVLLTCAAGCFVLANAIVRESDTDMTRSIVMRVTAFVLALGIFPLTVFAAISMGTRVAQYGLSPERLWGLTAIAVAVAYGLAAWGAAIRGRIRGWRPYLRGANMNLAVGVSAFALFLALPILDFGGISAANQLSRLERGVVSPEEFDYDALKWDFGDAGKRALAKLEKSGNAGIAKLAKEAQARTGRPWRPHIEPEERAQKLANLHYEFEDAALRKEVEEFVSYRWDLCGQPCVVIDLGPREDGSPHLAIVGRSQVTHLGRDKDGKLDVTGSTGATQNLLLTASASDRPAKEAYAKPPKVEVRSYAGRQIYVEGKPVGEPFE